MDDLRNEVTIVDVRMPFWSMVVFMVKAAIAAIPAMIILTMLYAVPLGFLMALADLTP